jgi:dolichyl-phosphate-mannose--protein O-mannosyl transferase
VKTVARLIGSTRFWTALIGLITVVAVQFGVPQEKANALSASILGVITVLIGSYTVRSA